MDVIAPDPQAVDHTRQLMSTIAVGPHVATALAAMDIVTDLHHVATTMRIAAVMDALRHVLVAQLMTIHHHVVEAMMTHTVVTHTHQRTHT